MCGIKIALLLFLCVQVEVNCQLKKCNNKCTRRNFQSQVTDVCVCKEKQFCNESTRKCTDCGECFNKYDKELDLLVHEFQSAVENLIKKYEINLDKLAQLIKNLQTNSSKAENEVIKLKSFEKMIKNTMENLRKNLKNLKNYSNNLDDYLNELKNILAAIKKLLDNLTLKENDVAKLLNNFSKTNSTLFNIVKTLGTFDDIKNLTTLSAANDLNVDFDLNLLESMIGKYKKSNLTSIPKENEIDENLKVLLTLLLDISRDFNDLTDLSQQIEQLKKAIREEKDQAAINKSDLQKLLDSGNNLEEYLKQLKREEKYLKKIRNNVEEIEKFVDNPEKYINNFEAEIEKTKALIKRLNDFVLASQKLKEKLNDKELQNLVRDAEKVYGDGINPIESDWKAKLDNLEKQFVNMQDKLLECIKNNN